MNPVEISEINWLLHQYGSKELLEKIANDSELYQAPGVVENVKVSQAEVALIGLGLSAYRNRRKDIRDADTSLLQILRTFSKAMAIYLPYEHIVEGFFVKRSDALPPHDYATWPEFACLTGRLAIHRAVSKKLLTTTLNHLADLLEKEIQEHARNTGNDSEPADSGKRSPSTKRANKKSTKQRSKP